jgi:hypothetical protein
MAVAAHRDPGLRVHLRVAQPSDENYIRSVWRESWALAAENKRLPFRAYKPIFRSLVADGVLAEPDTEIIVACDPADPDAILAWACYTPDRSLPVLHFAYVRSKHQGQPLRRRGVFGLLVAAIGIRDGGDVAYTSHCQEFAKRESNQRFGLEDALLDAALRHRIVARYTTPAEFLGRARRR